MSFNVDISLKCVYMFRFCLIASTMVKFSTDAFLLARELPCVHHDSSEIEDKESLPNNSIILNVNEYRADQYCDVNYILINGELVTVEKYVRGCICAIKPCLRLCCPHGSFIKLPTEKDKCDDNEMVSWNYIDEKNQTSIFKLNEYFVYSDRVCDVDSGHSDVGDLKVPKIIMGTMMFASAIFLIITLIVYAIIPELRNFHGKCLQCFLLSLAVAFTVYPLIRMNEWYLNRACENIEKFEEVTYNQPKTIEIASYLLYMSVVSACLWLNVISFDLWFTFRKNVNSTEMFSERIRFLLCAIYAFGLPILLGITADLVTDTFGSMSGYYVNVKLQFGPTRDEYKLNETRLYFVPVGILFGMNIVLFTLTAINIRRENKTMKELMSQEENGRGQKVNSDSFFLYLRMFILMGIEASVEVLKSLLLAYCGRYNYDQIFVYVDIVISAHGIFIFIMFVLRPRVLKLIKKRLLDILGKS